MHNIISYVADFGINYFREALMDEALPDMKGNNGGHLLVVAARDDIAQATGLLDKILQAIGYDITNDASLLALEAGCNIALASNEKLKQYRHVISFGVTPRNLGFAIDQHVGKFNLEALVFMVAPSLATLKVDAAAKKELWQLLKSEFQNQ